MKTKFKKPLIASLIAIALAFLPLSAFAECSSDVCGGDYPESVKSACGCSDSDDTLPSAVQSILSNIILVSGIIAVVFIVIGGIQYMTSTGDPGKTKKARDTILYAVIGLIICALAFTIVNFVINNILDQSTNDDDDEDEEEALVIPLEEIAYLNNNIKEIKK